MNKANLVEAQKYLERLKHDKEVWQAHVDALPGDTIDASHPAYHMAVSAANKYAVAQHMYNLLTSNS